MLAVSLQNFKFSYFVFYIDELIINFTLLLLKFNYSFVLLCLLKKPPSHLFLHTSLNFSLSSGDKCIIFSLIFLSLKSFTPFPKWKPQKSFLLKINIPIACQYVIDFAPKISGRRQFHRAMTIQVTPKKINGGQRIKKIHPFLCL